DLFTRGTRPRLEEVVHAASGHLEVHEGVVEAPLDLVGKEPVPCSAEGFHDVPIEHAEVEGEGSFVEGLPRIVVLRRGGRDVGGEARRNVPRRHGQRVQEASERRNQQARASNPHPDCLLLSAPPSAARGPPTDHAARGASRAADSKVPPLVPHAPGRSRRLRPGPCTSPPSICRFWPDTNPAWAPFRVAAKTCSELDYGVGAIH